MDQEREKKVVLTAAFCGIVVLGVYLSVKFLLPPMLPFLLGFVIAWGLHKPSGFLAEKLHLDKRLPAILLTAVFYIAAFFIILFVGIQIVSAAKEIVPQLPSIFTDQVLPFINSCTEKVESILKEYDPSLLSAVDLWITEATGSLSQSVTSISASALKLMSNIAVGTPEMILKIVLTVVSTFFISKDFDSIVGFIKKLLPAKYRMAIGQVREKAVTSIAIFVRSYFLIFLLTAAELSVGLWLLNIPYAVEMGILIAVVDIMPVLGTGLVLLPWSLIAVVIGEPFLGIGLFLLYVIITAIRNIVEPKLVGGKIGLHPLAALISMFLGLQLFGLMGLFLFPVILSLAVQLKRDGLLPHISF